MEQWILLPAATKMIDLLLVAGAIFLIFSIVYMFAKIFKRDGLFQKAQIPTPLGALKIGDMDDEGSADGGGNTISIINNSPRPDDNNDGDNGDNSWYKPLDGMIPITSHSFFTSMLKAEQGRVVQLKTKNFKHCPEDIMAMKNATFTHLLFKVHAPIIREMVEEYVKECIRTHGDRGILASIDRRVVTAISRYEADSRKTHVDVGDGKFILGIPDIMIATFNKWHQPHIDILLARVENILISQFYPTWQLKLISILGVFETVYAVTFEYAEYGLMELNGELDEAMQSHLVVSSN